jgi:hypothetical protein
MRLGPENDDTLIVYPVPSHVNEDGQKEVELHMYRVARESIKDRYILAHERLRVHTLVHFTI